MRRESSSSVKIWRAIPREDVLEMVSAFANRVMEDGQIREIWLFGSYATGNYAYGSDVDLCIVLSDDSRWDYGSIAEVFHDMSIGVEGQFHIYSSNDFDRMLNEGSPFLEKIISEGVQFKGV